MLTTYDYIVIAIYFVFMLGIGRIFRFFIKDTSDYFRGGGQMLWWMVGSSAFMVQFSAWTFTAGAGKAYEDGPLVLTIFFANAVGFFINYLYFAPRFRQMRVITPIEGVRLRFGPINEQFFTWILVPIGVVQAGIWLNGLGVFFSAVFGFDLALTIIVTGSVVLLVALWSGSWGVVASDFMQVLILMPISVVAAFLALYHIGGIEELVVNFPADSFLGNNVNYPIIAYIWIFLIFFRQFASTNNMLDASRYLNARDSSHARKAALLAAVLFIVGPIVWFIPPMVTRVVEPDLASVYPQLPNPSEASFVRICQIAMPVGMLGVLASAIFSATLSSMDSGLNRSAGIFVRNFYRPLIRPKANEGELLYAGKALTIGLGAVIIGVAYIFSQSEIKLFDLMLLFGALVVLPANIPLILGMVIRKTPDWSAWATVFVGLGVSLFCRFVIDVDWLMATFDLETPLSARERSDYLLITSVALNTIICSSFFIGTRFFYKEPAGKRHTESKTFWDNITRPVERDETHVDNKDFAQARILGAMSVAYGIFLIVLMLIPNDLIGRLSFAFCGVSLLVIGLALRGGANKAQKAEAALQGND